MTFTTQPYRLVAVGRKRRGRRSLALWTRTWFFFSGNLSSCTRRSWT